jgi:hypothetical protein
MAPLSSSATLPRKAVRVDPVLFASKLKKRLMVQIFSYPKRAAAMLTWDNGYLPRTLA